MSELTLCLNCALSPLLSEGFILGSGTILAKKLNPAENLMHWRGHTQTEIYLTPSFPCKCNLFFMVFQPVFSPGDGIFSPQQSEKVVSIPFLSAVLKSKHLPSPENTAL